MQDIGMGAVQSPGTPASGGMSVEEQLRALKEQYENSPEYILGAEIIDGLEENGMAPEDVAMLLTRASRPGTMEAISASAGDMLASLAVQGKLKRPAEDYIGDENFIKLLLELPADKAVRMYDAQLDSRDAEERLNSERNNAAQDVIEKLKARRALPKQMRSAAPSSARVDYSAMSSEDFEAAKRRIFGDTGVR